MGELLADLMLDCDLPGAQIELILPLKAGQWRILDGLGPDHLPIDAFDRSVLAGLDWPLDPDDHYLSATACGTSTLIVGVGRSMLQAWIDVVEDADLPLKRVEWSLSAALRGMQRFLPDVSGDLAWVLQDRHRSVCRLILLREGVPEVDCSLPADAETLHSIKSVVQAWRMLAGVPEPLSWLISVGDAEDPVVAALNNDPEHEPLLQPRMTWTPTVWPSDPDPLPLLPLEHFALAGVEALVS